MNDDITQLTTQEFIHHSHETISIQQAYNHEAYKHSKLKNMQKGQFQIKNCID